MYDCVFNKIWLEKYLVVQLLEETSNHRTSSQT